MTQGLRVSFIPVLPSVVLTLMLVCLITREGH